LKRREFIRKLEALGCRLKRSGARHDIYENPDTSDISSVPRHQELADTLCKEILKQLGFKPKR
jgi:predicted RNA binding protein YcfA (HicA-like mRNA interferase family)